MTRSIAGLGGEGILTEADLADLSAGTRRVYNLMKDGRWHSRYAICLAAGHAGVPAQAGDRRMRELRDVPWLSIDRRRVPGTRRFEYRLQSFRFTVTPDRPIEDVADDALEQGEMFP